MSVLLLMLKSGEELIAETKELLLEEKVIGFQLTNPQVLSLSRATTLNEESEEENKISVNFSKWQIYSDDTEFRIPIDWVVTVCNPIESLKTSYEAKFNERTVSAISE
jgi:hypothetical protein